ncbi:hypothetical protein Y032_0177g619 [Ancylostoma ceylanicum]|uniref:SCP domain-containing protein n=1 Tax=Ancylostoma ceylanicum TaxID=53326 RepID=A0A016STY5_9BILA|nr:hypothetical protein Y032_0177g619 [Ancylostoma ceylanicum]
MYWYSLFRSSSRGSKLACIGIVLESLDSSGKNTAAVRHGTEPNVTWVTDVTVYQHAWKPYRDIASKRRKTTLEGKLPPTAPELLHAPNGIWDLHHNELQCISALKILEEWSCDLEQKAREVIGEDCSDPGAPPTLNNGGLANIFSPEYQAGDNSTAGQVIKSVLDSHLVQIDMKKLGVRTYGTVISHPIYTGNDELLLGYANLVRATNTGIGCTINMCPATDAHSDGLVTSYCLMNGETIKQKEPIYEGTTVNEGGCEEVTCPAMYKCNATTNLCERTATSGPSATTMTPVKAEFPEANGRGRCQRSSRGGKMTDELRDLYTEQHNIRRRKLAKGKISGKDGKSLPNAANMWRIVYDCDLEKEAIEYASGCPSSPSQPSERSDLGENFGRLEAESSLNFKKAVRKAVAGWWDVVGSVNYFGNSVTYLEGYNEHPISSFTQMAWAKTEKIGCSIAKCKDQYVSICRYSPSGNIANEDIYQKGRPCSAKPSASCDNGLLVRRASSY